MNRSPSGSKGEVILIGSGPGDPGLITLAGAEALSRADVVVHDQLIDLRVLRHARRDAELIAAGKSKGRCLLSQDEINALLVERAERGQLVARLKGGDPFVFGRGAEEAEHLRSHGIRFRVIPGITAAMGATAYAGIPLTHRASASAVAFVTGHHDPLAPALETGRARVDWPAVARFPGTIVVYMGLSRCASIVEVLLANGLPASTPAAIVASGSLPRQRTIVGTVETIPSAVASGEVTSPALLVIGEAVRHHETLAWFDAGPLTGKTILLTRPEEQSESTLAALEALGAEVISAPMVEIRPIEDTRELDAVCRDRGRFDWVVFTSSNGVHALIDRLHALGLDLRWFGASKIAAIGPSTARTLLEHGLRADLVPPDARSESLAEALRPLVGGRRVLLARADRGRPLLREALAGLADVEEVAVYRNVDVEALSPIVRHRLETGRIDWITLSSSAIARRLHSLLPLEIREEIGRSIRLASISPVTSAAARELGWSVHAEAARHDWDALIEAITAAESLRGV
ncbi:MAG: uroporphyrinogen-III C-methyltransferase [Isosphaeraceae bacterium]|nr:uroporphyrinogen-III C-methyltransferase [Isosphaeraceae bacterium]